MLDVSLVNRGETSIAKDWVLCILQDGQPHRFMAQRYSDETKAAYGDRVSIADAVFSNPVEHGHAVRGWLLFRVPKDMIEGNLTPLGSLQCRDYLDDRTTVGFSYPPPPRKQRKASSGLRAAVK